MDELFSVTKRSESVKASFGDTSAKVSSLVGKLQSFCVDGVVRGGAATMDFYRKLPTDDCKFEGHPVQCRDDVAMGCRFQ